MSATIHHLVPAETGWRAFYRGEYPEDRESARVVAWALMGSHTGETEVVGLVVAADDPVRVVPAMEGASAVAPDFERYGFRGDEA